MSIPSKQSMRLILLGVSLFLMALLVGLFIPLLANPRMGLSTHLEGIMNGLFLGFVGLVWDKVILPAKWLNLSFGLLVYGAFANFIAVLLAALTGAGKMMPIALGKEGGQVEETIISFLLISLSLAMIAALGLILAGLYRFFRQLPEKG
ncbi:hypothetical protein KJS94_01965 [Flavihumibacter rivuli]|uniref:hypothetical protein n=1 Tax=Flavihumibacter rivuli TaxID=2838156 RepID=UPI001BDF22A8|nr:hypothetical protein [Flavihumibacter rivuli]ULQ56960.1 hypothetical protein KJS94_01965 [Flavihumibacter rivuli]